MNKNNLLIIIPAYNEEQVIESVLQDWANITLGIEFKILVINDGSKDKTSQIIDKVIIHNDKIIKIDKINSGHGNTIIDGYKYAINNKYGLIFQTDSDDQFKPKDFNKLFLQFNNEIDLVLGVRKKRNDGFIRVVLSKLFLRSLIFLIFGKLIYDPNIPYRLIRGTFLEKFINKLDKKNYLAPNILMSIYAKKIKMVNVSHYKRTTGDLNWSFKKLITFCSYLIIEIATFKFKK